MKRLVFILSLCWSISVFPQQISIPRIEQMPDLPTPYQMRDWKQVAWDYNNFVFDSTKTGTYLPLVSFRSSGVNFSAVQSIKLDTYVGQSSHGSVAEAINILPAIVGASLVGINKINDLGINWVSKVKDFYNSANGENVYLNNYSASTGSDWWYEVMPNVFFYQLYSLYPNADSVFATQYTTIANRELKVIEKLGADFYSWSSPSMNYRAFNLLTGEPNSTSVPEPETAGSIAWILYQAYRHTGDIEYRYGAELSLDFLQNWSSNPSYEIQLPYGIATAARMNAIEGTNFDIEKFMNWTFSSGTNTLRGWGTIVGTWNDYDVSGLIGEANDAGDDYAFVMNGFQHAAALVPVAKYDKRFARAIGKWILNLANASRLFYRTYLPQSHQETASYAWSLQYDSMACIPYESMKETWNSTSPFAMGDAVNGSWASTDLSLYSGSSVGYLAAVVDTTNISGILKINVNKTDFAGENNYPTYLYYNPYSVVKTVSMNLPSGNFDVYDMISDTLLQNNVSSSISLAIPADSVVMPVLVPTGSTTKIVGRKFQVVNGNVIDYHYHYDYINTSRIKAVAADTTLVKPYETVHFKCYTENTDSAAKYLWIMNDSILSTGTTNTYTWTSDSIGVYPFFCKVIDASDTLVSDTLKIQVLSASVIAPQIDSIVLSGNNPYDISSNISVTTYTNDAQANITWKKSGGSLTDSTSFSPTWTMTDSEGIYTLTLTMSNELGSDSLSVSVLVKNLSDETTQTPMIYFPFSGNTDNAIQNAYDGVSVNAQLTTDVFGNANSAYEFENSNQYIYVANDSALNFTDKIAISLWIKPNYLPSSEQFIISHGSWENRYKLSITPEKHVRWTVKTDEGTMDVDDPKALSIGTFVYYTVQYTGYSLEVYRNGQLAAFEALSGNIGTTNKDLTLARKDRSTTDYNFRGTIDEVKIFNAALSVNQITSMPDTIVNGIKNISTQKMCIYPNPFSNEFYIQLPNNDQIESIWILDLQGRIIWQSSESISKISIFPKLNHNGIYVLKIKGTSSKMYLSKLIRIS